MRGDGRTLAGIAALACAAALGFVLAGAAAPAHSQTAPLSIAISGNHFVNGAGQTVQLVGVDVPSSEYACIQGWGYSSGDDATLAGQIAAWGVNVVRIPLNEDCWLGINGEPDDTSDPLTAAGYQFAIEAFVSDLNADGIYAILDLHWSAPGAYVADEQEPMPDSNSLSFWESVAGLFKDNPAVIFDAFNEPFSPAENYADESAYPVSWSCWLNGGCPVTLIRNNSDPGASPVTYAAVGMQQLIDAIRGTGATQPIIVGGLQYAEDLSGWLGEYEPTDTLKTPQLAASFHNYEGDGICDDVSCWNSTIAPIAAKVPVVTGEFAQDECPSGTDNFDDTYMSWADQHGVSYLGWGWFLLTGAADCNNYYLVDANGAPQAPNGTSVYAHLQALDAPGGLTQTTTTATTTATTPLTFSPPRPRACVVPRVAGDVLKIAERRIRAAHCKVGRITGPRSRRDLVVAATTPRAGRREPHGARVALRMRRRRRRA
jgi:endoglucanase